MHLDMEKFALRNAVFLSNPQNRHNNELHLILNADRLDDPNAHTIILHNIHPTLGDSIERILKQFGRATPMKKS